VSDVVSGTTLSHVDVSAIIPSHCTASECTSVLKGIGLQSLLPKKVILIRVSHLLNGESAHWCGWIEEFLKKGVTLKLVEEESTLFPGAARNLGLKFATTQWVAFLDVETIPCKHWLRDQMKSIEASSSLGAFGSTIYATSSFKQALVRDAIYGRRPIQTLPGSVFSKDVFNLVGQFIPVIRAAEDTEWMIRAKAMGVRIAANSYGAQISYKGLSKLGLRGLARKWRRNYLSSRQLQHLKVQTTIVWLLGYVVVSLIAFNWNAIVAGWQVDSPFYLDHVTKIVSLTPIALYIIFRGFYLPFKRGVPLSDIFPFRFMMLAAVGAFLDAVKVSTIFIPKESR
jgi:hypothetical protein